MRTTLTLTPLLLLGACANLIVGEEEGAGFTPPDGSYSAEADFTEFDTPDEAVPEMETTTEAWRMKRGQVLRTFAFRALERGLIEEARGYLEEACQLDPTDVESHCALARLFLSEGDSRAAAAYAERAATANPKNPGARLVYAATLAETGQTDEANDQVELAWERSGHDPALARAMVTHFAADEPNSGAAQTFVKQVLAEHPRDPRSWTAAGDLFLAQGQVDEAAPAYAEAIALDPSVATPRVLESYLGKDMGDVDPVLAAAVQAERDGDLAGAERLYRFLISSKGHDSHLQAGLARVLWRRGRLESSQAALDSITVEKRSWRDHLLEAKIRFTREDWEGARGSLLLVLELRPELRAAELLLGHVERRMAGLDDAALEQAIDEAIEEVIEEAAEAEGEDLDEHGEALTEPEAEADEADAASEHGAEGGAGESADEPAEEPEAADEPAAAEEPVAEEPVVTEPDPVFGAEPATQPDGTPFEPWGAAEPAVEPAEPEPAAEPAAEPATEPSEPAAEPSHEPEPAAEPVQDPEPATTEPGRGGR